MNFLSRAVQTLKQLHPAAKKILQLGGYFIVVLLFAALVTYYGAEHLGSYYRMQALALELLASVRPCLGIIFLGALITQVISPAPQDD